MGIRSFSNSAALNFGGAAGGGAGVAADVAGGGAAAGGVCDIPKPLEARTSANPRPPRRIVVPQTFISHSWLLQVTHSVGTFLFHLLQSDRQRLRVGDNDGFTDPYLA